MYLELNLEQSGTNTAGKFLGDEVQGNLQGKHLHFIAKSAARGDEDFTAVMNGDFLSGTLGMVNCTPAFTEHPKVINGCSDLFVEVFGEAVGRHARSAVGVSSLPCGITVEIEAIVAVRPA